jgi:hypothetical protein
MSNPVAIGDGRAVVAASGTAVQLSTTPNIVTAVQVTALPTNTNLVWVGGPTVKAAVGQERGTPLSELDTFYMEVADLSRVYIDAITNGEGVTFTYTDTVR